MNSATLGYRQYLDSDLWRAKRDDALRKALYRCQVCNGGGELHVHHRTYQRVGRERPEDLIVLCAACHHLFHTYCKKPIGN